eukprot:3007687-Pyramimonas_sp.AAC.1
MQRADGQVADNAAEMANALKTHWERPFQTQPVDFDIMRAWLVSLPNDCTDAPPQLAGDPLGRSRALRR